MSALTLSATTRIRRRRTRLVLGTLLGLAVVAVGLAGLDRWFYENVAMRFNTVDRPLDRDWYAITKPLWTLVRFWPHLIGGAVCYGAILAYKRRAWRRANAAALAVLTAALVANALQLTIGRARPNHSQSNWQSVEARGWLDRAPVGFPSGEAATAFALAWVMRRQFPAFAPLFGSLAALTLLARVLPGMHYLSDAAAGAVLGVWLARCTYRPLMCRGRRLLLRAPRAA